MDFQTKELQAAVSKLKSLVNSKTPYEAAKGILYDTGKMTATDMTVYATVSVSAGLIPTDEKFIIPNTAFDVISKLPAETVSIVYDENTSFITVESGKFKTKYATAKASDFPVFANEGDGSAGGEIDYVSFLANLICVAYATSDQESKGSLVGVNVVAENDRITVTALDGFRAAQKTGYFPSDKFSTIVTKGFWNALAKMGGSDANAVLTVTSKTIGIKTATFEIKARTLEGQFPDVSTIIKSLKPDKSIVATRDAVLQALELHSSAMKDNGKNNLIVLTVLNSDTVQFSAKTASSQFSYEIPAECNGFTDGFQIGFNATYILEAVKAMQGTDSVLFKLQSSVTGVLVYDNEHTDDGVALVLPVRVNQN